MIKLVDATGKKCPLPIILTKKCIDNSKVGDVIEVIVDNDMSKCNLVQYLNEINIQCKERVEGDSFNVTFELSANVDLMVDKIEFCPIVSDRVKNINDYVIVIKSDKMGDGDDELGNLLIRSYVNILPELETLPKMIIFYNSGVKLINKGVDTLEALSEMERLGVEIISCGVCVDYYDISVSVGSISNMYKIGNSVANTSKVIYP